MIIKCFDAKPLLFISEEQELSFKAVNKPVDVYSYEFNSFGPSLRSLHSTIEQDSSGLGIEMSSISDAEEHNLSFISGIDACTDEIKSDPQPFSTVEFDIVKQKRQAMNQACSSFIQSDEIKCRVRAGSVQLKRRPGLYDLEDSIDQTILKEENKLQCFEVFQSRKRKENFKRLKGDLFLGKHKGVHFF